MKKYSVKIKTKSGRIAVFYLEADTLTAAKSIVETLFELENILSIPKSVVQADAVL